MGTKATKLGLCDKRDGEFSSELPMSLTKIDCEQSLFCSKICESARAMMQVCKVCEFLGRQHEPKERLA